VSLAEATTQRRYRPETEGYGWNPVLHLAPGRYAGAVTEDHHELPTPRTTLAAQYVRVLVFCRSCRHRRDADLQALSIKVGATCR
jgi:hypothetical protein